MVNVFFRLVFLGKLKPVFFRLVFLGKSKPFKPMVLTIKKTGGFPVPIFPSSNSMCISMGKSSGDVANHATFYQRLLMFYHRLGSY